MHEYDCSYEENAPRVTREVKTIAVKSRIYFEPSRDIDEAILCNRHVPTKFKIKRASYCFVAAHTALPRELPHQATVRLTSTFFVGGRMLNLVTNLRERQQEVNDNAR